jgi:hypothetical protein
MAMDESVQNLISFVALVKQTIAQVGEQTNALTELDGDLDEIDDEEIGRLGDELQKRADALEAAQHQAADGLAKVGAAAEGVVADELAEGAQQASDTAGACEQAAERDAGALAQGWEALHADGFEGAAQALAAAGERTDELGGDADDTFEELGGALDSVQADVEEARGDAVTALDEAAESLAGEETQGLEGEAGAAVAEWQGVPGEFETACDGSRSELETAYSAFLSEAQSLADELEQAVAGLARDATEAIEGQGSSLAEESDGTDGALAALGDEGGEAVRTLEAGAAVSGELAPVLVDLVGQLPKVATIDELLKALG